MILFRDTCSRGGTRLPAWLDGCADLQRMPTDGGDIVTAGDPLYLIDPIGATWLDIGDGWQVTTNNGLDFGRYERRRVDIERIRVKDAIGREWMAPKILGETGGCALSVPWGKKDGVRVRAATPEQERLITAATAAREEILAGKLGEVPIDIVAEWVHCLLASLYHLSSEVIDALQLLDDTLAAGVLLAASGFPKPLVETAPYVAL